MVVILTYTKFAEIAKLLGEEENLKDQALEIKQGALAICQAILYVKQHSVNCIPGALYAMTRFIPELFPKEEAKAFVGELFSPAPVSKEPQRKVHPSSSPSTKLPDKDVAEFKEYILNCYYKFLEEGKDAKYWYEPIINFLRSMR
jgi:hypothetical protein